MNVFVVQLMLAVAVFAVGVRLFVWEYERKTRLTIISLVLLTVLAYIQATSAKTPPFPTVFWLLIAIFVVLLVSTIISKKQWEKEQEKDDDEIIEEITEKPEAKKADKPKPDSVVTEFEDVDTPPAPPAL